MIDDFAFARSGISGEVVVPSTVTLLGNGYFLDCPNLTKITYLCNVLFFKDPTHLSTDIWNMLAKPKYTVYDISGDIQVSQDQTSTLFRTISDEETYYDACDNFVYTANNVRKTILAEAFVKRVNTGKVEERKQGFTDLLGYIKPIYATLDAKKTLNALETRLRESLYCIIFKITELYFNSPYLFDQIPDISSQVQTYIYDISSACRDLSHVDVTTSTDFLSVKYPQIINKFNTILNANRDIFIVGSNMTDVDITVKIPEKNISVKVLTEDIRVATGGNTVIFEEGIAYILISSPIGSIELFDGTLIEVSGQIRLNLSELIGPEYYKILKHISDNIETINGDTEINIDFKGAITAISSLTDLRNSIINITSERLVIYDSAMKIYTGVQVNITSSVVKIYDMAFQLWKYSTLNMTADKIICGKYLFLDSSNIKINSTIDLVNKTKFAVVNAGDKTIYDISAIVLTNTGVEVDTDTRDFCIQTYVPPEADIATGFPVLRFQQVSSLVDYVVILAPDDWYWCYRTSSGSDFVDMLNSGLQGVPDIPFRLNYRYIPQDAMRDYNGNLVLRGGLPDPPEYCGLQHSFAPEVISYGGIEFKRATQLDSGVGMRVRAVYSFNEEAGYARKKQALSSAFQIYLIYLSIVTAPVPIASAIVNALELVKTTVEIINTIDDQFSETQFALDFSEETREIYAAAPRAFTAIGAFFKSFFNSIFRYFTVSRGSRAIARISRPPGAAGVASGPGSSVATDLERAVISANPLREAARGGSSGLVPSAGGSSRRFTVPIDGGTSSSRGLVVDSPSAAAAVAAPSGAGRTITRRSLESLRAVSARGEVSSMTVTPPRVLTVAERSDLGFYKSNIREAIETINNRIASIESKQQIYAKALRKITALEAKILDLSATKKLAQANGKQIKSLTKEIESAKRTLSILERDEGPEAVIREAVSKYLRNVEDLKRIDPSEPFESLPPIPTFGAREISTSNIYDAIRQQLIKYFNYDITDIALHPNYNTFLQNIHHLLTFSGGIGIRAAINILTYLEELRLFDTSSLHYAIKAIDLLKGTGPELNVSDVKFRDIAAYIALTHQYALAANDMVGSKVYITTSIPEVVRAAANARTPPYVIPVAYDRNYADKARADFIHHYTTLHTNQTFPSLETDIRGRQNAAMQRASPLMAFSDKYMFAGTFLGPERDPYNPQTGSYDYMSSQMIYRKVILECNNDYDEVYLANRPVIYSLDKDERPNNVFSGASDITVNIPQGRIKIGDYAYSSTDSSGDDFPFTIRSLILPNTLLNIGYRAFYRSQVKNVFFPATLAFIGNSAFENCGLVNAIAMKEGEQLIQPNDIRVTINSNTEIIFNKNNVTFRNFTNATVIDSANSTRTFNGKDSKGIPTMLTIEGMTSAEITKLSVIRRYTKYDNVNTADITYEKVGPINSFSYNYNDRLSPTIESYPTILFNNLIDPVMDGERLGNIPKSTGGWVYGTGRMFKIDITNESTFRTTKPDRLIYSVSRETIQRGTPRAIRGTGTVIGDNAFGGNTGLTTFIAPEDTTAIGANAFGGCTSLTWVDLPDTLTTISGGAFSGCSSLEIISLPASLTSIAADVFAGATALRTITFSGGLPPAITQDFLTSLPPSITNISVPPADAGALTQLLSSSGLSGKISVNSYSATNSFPVRTNPYRAIATMLIYTKETIEDLAAGRSLPATKEVVWSPAPAGAMMRPTGRYISVMGSKRLLRYKFAQVQLMNGGEGSEGVTGTASNGWNTGWICVWSADGVAPVL